MNELNDKYSMKNKDSIECNVKMTIVKELTFALCNYYFVNLRAFLNEKDQASVQSTKKD